MGESIALGPLLLPTQAVLLMLACAVALGVLGLLPETPGAERRHAESRLLIALLIGVLGARLAWVLRHWQAYAESPTALLAFRDGGYLPMAGVIVAALFLLVLALAARDRAKPTEGHEVPPGDGNTSDSPPPSRVGEGARVRRIQLLVPAGAAAAVLLAGLALLDAHAERTRRPLPEYRLLSLSGQEVDFPPAAGRPTVINLWASWCGPCRREMPAFTRVQAERPDIDFLYINIGESEAEVSAFTATLMQAPQPVLRDPEARLPQLLGVAGYPTTLILDHQGRLQARRSGELSDASLRALLPPPRQN